MIIAENIDVNFRRSFFKPVFKALNGFSLKINTGDIFGLLGQNGAGKSTAMYVFLGLIKPNRGSIKVLDIQPEAGSRIFEKILYIPEEPHYHLYLTVGEALKYYAGLYGIRKSSTQLKDILARFELSDFFSQPLSKCSKGMKQKLGLCLCFLKDFELIFLDEPTRGLDPVSVKIFRDYILSANRRGATFVINTHILAELEALSNRVAVIDKGKVIASDTVANLVKYDKPTYYIELENSSNINFPEFIKIEDIKEKITFCSIEPMMQREFFKFVFENNLNVIEFSLKRRSLEDAFFDIVSGDKK